MKKIGAKRCTYFNFWAMTEEQSFHGVERHLESQPDKLPMMLLCVFIADTTESRDGTWPD